MEIFGAIKFQSNGKQDVFLTLDVVSHDWLSSDEQMIGVNNFEFDSRSASVVGVPLTFHLVNIEGDTDTIHAWFKSNNFVNDFRLNIYVEYEEAEELIAVEPDREEVITAPDDCEIIL